MAEQPTRFSRVAGKLWAAAKRRRRRRQRMEVDSAVSSSKVDPGPHATGSCSRLVGFVRGGVRLSGPRPSHHPPSAAGGDGGDARNEGQHPVQPAGCAVTFFCRFRPIRPVAPYGLFGWAVEGGSGPGGRRGGGAVAAQAG